MKQRTLSDNKFYLRKSIQEVLSFLYVTEEAARRLEGTFKDSKDGCKPDFSNIFDIDRFDIIEPATDAFFALSDSLGEDEVCLLPEDINPKDVIGIDQSVIRTPPKDFTMQNGLPVKYHLCRIKQIDIKKLRGRISPLSPYIYDVHEAYVHPDASMSTAHNTYCYVNKKFKVLHSVNSRGFDSRGNENKWVYDKDNETNLLFPWSIAYTNYTRWKVAIGFRPYARIALSLSPKTIMKLFNDRDKPIEKNRRSPLQHLVVEHLRKHPYKTEDYISVIEHLRGNFSFQWQGLFCEIIPPRWLLDKMEYKLLLKNFRIA